YQPLHGMLDQGFEQYSRTDVVDAGVLFHLVHALADAYDRDEMIHGVDALERAPDRRAVPNVAHHQLDLGVQIAWARLFRTVHLRGKVIQNTNVTPSSQMFVGEVGADKTRPTG